MASDTQISIRLTTEQLDRAQRLADKAGISRHKLLHNIVTTGIGTLDDLDSVGVVGLAIMTRNIENYLKSFGKNNKTEIETN